MKGDLFEKQSRIRLEEGQIERDSGGEGTPKERRVRSYYWQPEMFM